ncbi:hypothetical protein POM88_027179 [Heracleum sosnowskyi]|uniref:TF-B3 domain-containing protein n=1 Tax=Heracleum sosnowskyi TaxID=360622 RepID=A0AAD8I817_9APIA|nr:hypothetical protein POM88_027179 [Heracleum sosnowskyi]
MTGCLPLPTSIAERYGNDIPDRVIVVLPSGALWTAKYMRDRNCIEQLDNMYDYYNVKPYHMFAVKYNGGSRFHVQIYNSYGVEIDYPAKPVIGKKLNLSRYSGGWVNEAYYLSVDFEIDKLCAQFTFNCLNTGRGDYDLLLSRSHLKGSLYTQVFSKNACSQLALNDSMKWVEIGYNHLFWKIKLKWKNGKVWFNRKWNEFATAGELRHGDICVFQKTEQSQKFEVCVFEKKNMNNFNQKGLAEGKAMLSWLKVMNEKTTSNGELEVPRLFVDQHGLSIADTVHLLMPDGLEYFVSFCGFRNVLHGLKKVLLKYSVGENYVLCFDYVGESHFYVSIYDTTSVDIFDDLSVKVLLQDVMRQSKCPVIVLSDDSVDEDKVSSFNLMTIDNAENLEEAVDNNNMEVLEDMQLLNVEGENQNSFSVRMSKSHVDHTGHGVYLPRTILAIYKKWKKGTVVTLVCGERVWKVEVHRKKKMCRFGKGWDNFTSEKELVKGQWVEFVYRN